MGCSCKGNTIDHAKELNQACKDLYKTFPGELHKNKVLKLIVSSKNYTKKSMFQGATSSAHFQDCTLMTVKAHHLNLF